MRVVKVYVTYVRRARCACFELVRITSSFCSSMIEMPVVALIVQHSTTGIQTE